MTWEPTTEEAAAYASAARKAAEDTTTEQRAARLIKAGLRAAYALLEQRVNAGDVLGQLVHDPDQWEYRRVHNADMLAKAGTEGWRLEHVLPDPADPSALLYILERPIRG